MKISKRQQQEIEFLIKTFKVNPSDRDKSEYIEVTVHGKGDGRYNKNPLIQAKRRLDMSVKMWRKDIKEGILFPIELIEDFDCEYGTSLVKSLPK